ncbi:polysaccharide pyruvyl transferase family protein [Neobacillus niacini]|uniref:polysaccharide pyruvyl transferase family protein n=1 Tax=Neobacillus niacini TaxID=86668 RepID=UPI00398348C6
MKNIALFDTSIGSDNLGDQIIMEAVEGIILDLFPNDYLIKFPTHDVISNPSYKLIKTCNNKFVGGTNLLTSDMKSYKLWKIDINDVKHIKEVILLGVGWLKYQGKPNQYTANIYKQLLSKRHLHSVRDSYTEKQLKSIGIQNVINTSCPTMWGLTPEFCKQIPTKKASKVLFTLSEWKKEVEQDKKLINMLERNYSEVYFWSQGIYDFQYLQTIGCNKVKIISPSILAFDQFLLNNEVDYIGTRLHGGIRALKCKKRSLVLAVDNRAVEISKDTNLAVSNRYDFPSIENWINDEKPITIHLPIEKILEWKAQFNMAEST